jgi:predicted secreted hydrolase
LTRFALIAFVISFVFAACGSSADSSSSGEATATATRSAAALLTPIPKYQPIAFPLDEAPHDNMTEWWYYTGHLFDLEGHRYGFEYVIFQVQRGNFPPFYASHFAITDNPNDRFTYDQKSGFDGLVETEAGFHLQLDDWEMQGANGIDRLAASMDGYEMDLTLTTDAEPVLHYEGSGFMQIGIAGSSYYYSRPGMEVEGTLTVDGETMKVTGSAWMDHQWGDFVLIEGGGWDWFAIELADDTAIMVFQLRGIEGVGDIEDFGTLVQPDGTVEHLAENDFIIEAQENWTSPATGATYPVSWSIEIPSQELTLELEPSMNDQELDTRASTSTIYWEGEMVVEAQRGTQELTGLGYVELTGYADSELISP